MIEIDLPWPPSANTYYRHPTKGKLAGRHLISEQGRKYRADVVWKVKPLGFSFAGRIAVSMTCHMPDRRKRDLDNLCKGFFDALTHAGLWFDDSQIDDLHIKRGPIEKGGRIVLRVSEICEVAA